NVVVKLHNMLKDTVDQFNQQLKEDGWAEDFADGFSKIWNNPLGEKLGISTGNTADQVRKKIAQQQNNLIELFKAAGKDRIKFEAKFEEIYGAKYNEQAINTYIQNPTPENYQEAFGDKITDITTIVQKYKKSNETGANVVKTTAKVSAGLAIGAATGGTGFVALAAAAGATAASSIVIEETDNMNITGNYTDASGNKIKTEGLFKESTNHAEILKEAAWDGASVLAGGGAGKVAGSAIKGATTLAKSGRAAINILGDTAVGAAREYTETGDVTLGGVAANAITSGVGSAVTSGAAKAVGKYIGQQGGVPKTTSANSNTKVNTTSNNAATTTNAGSNANANSTTLVNNGKKTYEAPDLKQSSFELEDDIAANTASMSTHIKTAFNENNLKRGCLAGSSNEFSIKLVENNGNKIVYITNIGSKPRNIKMEPNMTEVIGKDSSGRSVILNSDANGTISIAYGEAPKGFFSKIKRTFGVSEYEPVVENTAKQRPVATQHAQDNSIEIVQRNPSASNNSVKQGNSNAKHEIQTLGDNFVKIEDANVSIKKASDGGIIVKDSNGNEFITYVDVGESRVVGIKSDKSPGIVIKNVDGKLEYYIPQQGAQSKVPIISESTKKSLVNTKQTTDVSLGKSDNAVKSHVASTKPKTRQYKQNSISENQATYRQMARDGKSLVTTIPNNADISNISSFVANGDVCSLNGELYVNDNGNPVLLKMSQKTFDRLFNPAELGNIYQPNNTQTCSVISTINSSMAVPSGRSTIYQMFEETPDGIKINFKNNTSVTFNSGSAINAPHAKMGSTGLDMLEQGILLTHSSSTSSVYKNININERVDNSPLIKLDRRVQHPEDYHVAMHPEKLIYGKQFKSIKPTTTEEIENMIKNFDLNNSVMTGQSYGHQTAMTAYNPTTNTLIIHDQMGGAYKNREIPLASIINSIIRYSN
ncbi:MAG: hypothetical protein MJ231_01435, partial [bacterium]|nr:hypothetical protein [bacterium]